MKLVPGDMHDERLRAQVHPGDWINPTPRARYHLVVIGAGTAGLVTAAGAAGLGAHVALIERDFMGGDCLNAGCVPSKALIAAARAWSGARRAASDYHGPAVTGEGDFGAVMERMRRIRADMSPADGAPRFRALGVDVFFGTGSFTGPQTIDINGRSLSFRRAVVATGGHASVPSIPGLSDVPYDTNESIFALTTLPRRLLVLGGGPVGCEMAQAFARFGSRVTLVTHDPMLLRHDDRDAAAVVQARMASDGVTFRFGAEMMKLAWRGDEIVAEVRGEGGPEEIRADRLLVATGRAANVDGLGLEAAGVAHTHEGVIVDNHFRTSNRRVFAIGDVASARKFTHSADFQARAVIRNALFFGRQTRSDMVTPSVTYTSPELAQVGHTLESARAAGAAVQSIEVPMREVDRARLEGQTDGFVRILVAKGTGRIAGATIVAEHAGELISEATIAMTNGLGLAALGRTMHPYPTDAEALRKAADAWQRTKLTPRVKTFMSWWFKLFASVLLACGAFSGHLKAQSVDHSAFDALLRAHVTGGMVDYEAFRGAPSFPAYLATLASADPSSLPRDEQLALWINAYNAYTIQLILTHHERESIRNINRTFFLKLKGEWSEPLARVGGTQYTLDDIEHKIIRPVFREPRIHFALVCAAMGCPPLRNEAYTGARLDSQLDAQGRAFILESPAKNRVDVMTREWHHSMIFSYYKDDFGGSLESAARFVARWYPDGPEKRLLLSGDFATTQTEYDWTLNSREKAAGLRTP